MKSCAFSIVCCVSLWLLPVVSVVAEEPNWSGVWVTDIGVLELDQDGDMVSGKLNGTGQVDGTADGNDVTLTYQTQRGKSTATATLQSDNHSLKGTYGRRSQLRGWRQQSNAESLPLSNFSGLWLTTSGTMRLQQDGSDVSGPYGAEGWASIEGSVKGGRLTCTWTRIKSRGSAWFEMTADGNRLFGATSGKSPSRWIGIRIGDFDHHVQPQAGEIVKGHGDNGMLYHLRMPDGWKEGQPVDVIVLLHGSNWTTAGMVHVVGKKWPDLGKKFAILGIQGQKWADWSDTDDLRFNYDYVSWVGKSTYRGFPYTDRASPYLVDKLLDELAEQYRFDRIFVGGHSQGGFLTYLMHMNFPEKLAGTFPVAGGLIFQAEPSAFDDDALISAQRDTPMVIVHGRRDRVVSYSTGEYIHKRFLAHNFAKVKMLAPNLGHPFDFLPIGDAIDWLDVMSTKDSQKLLAFCQEKQDRREWRDLGAALQHARTIDAGQEFAAIQQAFEDAARADTDRLLTAIQANEDNAWVDDFLEWRQSFSLSEAGRAVQAEYAKLQAQHLPKAKELYAEARKAFRNRDRETGMTKYREIVEKYYASPRFQSLRDVLAKEKN